MVDKCLQCSKPLTQRMKDTSTFVDNEGYCSTKCGANHQIQKHWAWRKRKAK